MEGDIFFFQKESFLNKDLVPYIGIHAKSTPIKRNVFYFLRIINIGIKSFSRSKTCLQQTRGSTLQL